MSSTRLRGKALALINRKPMLYYVIRQTLASNQIDDVIVATTKLKEDDKIVEFCKENKIKYYRGSNEDVLDRFYKTAQKFHCDPVIRISSDCPLIDPRIIDKVLIKFQKKSFDYIGNNIEKIQGEWVNSLCKFPHGMVVEVSSFKALKRAWLKAKLPSEREHVFPYIQFHSKLFSISNFKNKKDFSYIRCTVDRKEDLTFVRKIYKMIPKWKKIITVDDIVSIINKHSELLMINNKFAFDEGYQKSLKKDLQV